MTESSALPIALTWTGDETLYSWCCRWHRLTLNQTRRSGMTLFGVPSAAKVCIAPNPFGRFAAVTRGELGSPGLILRQRTVVGSFLALARPSHRQRMQEGTLSPSYLVSAKSGMALTLRYCPRCATRQRDVSGLPYWSVHHQLPGVAVCLEHGEPLCEHIEKRQLWALPESGAAKEIDIASQLEMNGLAQVAVAAGHIFVSEALDVELMVARATRVIGEGYGALDAKHLNPGTVDSDWRRSVIARWSERTFPSSSAFPRMWISDLLRSRRSERSPLRWAFLVAYMQERRWITPQEFFEIPSNALDGQMSLWGMDCEIPSVIVHALSVSSNANQAAKLIGVNVVTVRRWVRTNPALSQVIAHWKSH